MTANKGPIFFNTPGNRSSIDDPSKIEPVSGEDEIVEPDQGNGLS